MGGNRSWKKAWLGVLVAACLLGLASVLTNIQTPEQMSGEAVTAKTIRLISSHLLNSGTVWAGFPILLGWWIRDCRTSWLAGVVGAELSLVAHYAIGQLIGVFEPAIWRENLQWFIAGAIAGPGLGLIGALMARRDLVGFAAALVVPAGALLEPFVVGMFFLDPRLPAPTRIASAVTGMFLLLGGIAGAVLAWRHRRDDLTNAPSWKTTSLR